MQPEIYEILNKYKEEELRISNSLQEVKQKTEISETNAKNLNENDFNLSLEEAVARNKDLLQELETCKGNLRSKAIFSPMEMQWDHIIKKYKEEPSLVVNKWRCHLPVFV